MFGEERVARARRECQLTMRSGREFGAPVGLALRVARRVIEAHGIPQPDDLVAWLTEGRFSDADVRVDRDEMVDFSRSYMQGGKGARRRLNRAVERAVYGA